MDIATLSLRTQADLIASGTLSSEALVRHYLDMISKHNGEVNAIVQVARVEDLIAQAQAADEKVRSGAPLGRLHGVPMTVKDMCKVAGFFCTMGTEGLTGFVAEEDATIVARVKAQGAIILGITNVPELLMAFETDNLVYGRTNHPLDSKLSPGGSSGGEAAAIASGCSPAGLGSDSMGSVRVPASMVGIVGLKVTQGRLPQTGRVPMEGASLHVRSASYGPMGRYIDDVALLLEIIAGPDGIDPNTMPVPVQDYQCCDISTLDVAWYENNGWCEVQPEIAQALRCAVDTLAPFVGSVTNEAPTCLNKVKSLALEMIAFGADGGQSWYQGAKLMGSKALSPLFEAFLESASSCQLTVTELRGRLREWDQYNFAMQAFSQRYPITLCPVSATTAQAHGHSVGQIDNYTFTMAYSLSGQPVATVCIGKDNNGLPIGVQVVGQLWCEHQVLAVASVLERAFSQSGAAN